MSTIQPVPAAPLAKKPRLVLEELGDGLGELLVSAGIPATIELRVDGATAWSIEGKDLLQWPERIDLRLRLARLTDAEVEEMPER
jgi:hypothetical protein